MANANDHRQVMTISALFDEHTHPFEGSALTSVVNTFENLDNQGHGAKIEAISMMPIFYLLTFPWLNGLDYKNFSSQMTRETNLMALSRDKYSGRVFPDPTDGRVRVDYNTSPFDRKLNLEAIIGAIKIAYVSGAREIRVGYPDLPPFIRQAGDTGSDGANNRALQEFIAEFRSKSPLSRDTNYFSAHQMGSCRMGVSPRMSVVDPSCRVWGTRGLYVMDASVFPSASGANPMLTNMGIADWASRNLANSIQAARL